VPFRLTRNFVSFLTPYMLDGVFASSMTAMNSCLFRNQDVLKNYMCLFIRDDLLSWNSAKVSATTSASQRQLEQQLGSKITENVGLVLKRIHLLMPAVSRQDLQPQAGKAPTPVNSKVHQLIKCATSKSKLCLMSPTWSPWF
jgi:transformation/transcription domain-associated protein